MFNSTLDLVWVFILFAASILVVYGLREARRAKNTLGTGWAIVGLAFATVLSVVLIFSSFNEVKSEGVAQECSLDQQYVQSQNVLSNYIDGFYEKLGVANLATAKVEDIDKILVTLLSGQSDLRAWSSAKSPLFLALVQVCPQVTLAQYQDLLAYIQQGRAQVQASQAKLLAQLSDFDKWRNSEIIFHPNQVKLFGLPDSNLHVTIGNRTLLGAEAEQQMYNIVLNPMAVEAFATGRQGPLSVNQ
ncbi:MAG: hypothetical protein P4L53_23660 [Candidatus Obscuribacterales bacterium]|nr:hypothetical protein [Candidatus Obscuribacterales bacterium]